MSGEKKYSREECHKRFAVDLFNFVWDLLDKKERTKEEDDAMIHAAHASRYHWGIVGTAVNLVRGEWQISRVYSVLNRHEPTLYHALRSLEICEENSIGDFDLAFSYEAIARAYSVKGDKSNAEVYIDLAKEAGDNIKKEEDKKLFLRELKTIQGC